MPRRLLIRLAWLLLVRFISSWMTGRGHDTHTYSLESFIVVLFDVCHLPPLLVSLPFPSLHSASLHRSTIPNQSVGGDGIGNEDVPLAHPFPYVSRKILNFNCQQSEIIIIAEFVVVGGAQEVVESVSRPLIVFIYYCQFLVDIFHSTMDHQYHRKPVLVGSLAPRRTGQSKSSCQHFQYPPPSLPDGWQMELWMCFPRNGHSTHPLVLLVLLPRGPPRVVMIWWTILAISVIYILVDFMTLSPCALMLCSLVNIQIIKVMS